MPAPTTPTAPADHPSADTPTHPPAAPSAGPQRLLPTSHPPAPAWPLHDTAGARTLEAHAAASLPPHTLMQRAGLGVARLALALAPHARAVWILAGPGNNGGDGFEAAIHLARAGRQVQISWLGSAARLPADATAALARARAAGLRIDPLLDQPEPAAGLRAPPLQTDDLVIDALLGRGLTRAADGLIGDAIRLINQTPARRLAVDLPSGLPGDSGALAPDAPCVHAHHTLALLSLAPGLFTCAGRDLAGEIWFDDLGIGAPQAARAGVAPVAWLGGPAALHGHWPARALGADLRRVPDSLITAARRRSTSRRAHRSAS